MQGTSDELARNPDTHGLRPRPKRARKSISLATKMAVIRRMEAGETRAHLCRTLNMAPATVSTIMANAEKIKESARKTSILRASILTYTRSPTIERMEQMLVLWVNDLHKRGIRLTRDDISEKAKSLFNQIQLEEGSDQRFNASRGWFARFKQRSQIYMKYGEVATKRDEVKHDLNVDNDCNDDNLMANEACTSNEEDDCAREEVAEEEDSKAEISETKFELLDSFSVPRNDTLGVDEIKKEPEDNSRIIAEPLQYCRAESTSAAAEDVFDITGRKIAYELRLLDDEQLIFAEKIINDAIYYAKLKKLDFNSRISV